MFYFAKLKCICYNVNIKIKEIVNMEREKSKHSLAMIGHSVGRLNGKFSQCFVGTFTFVAPLLLLLLGFGVLALCVNQLSLFAIGVMLVAMAFGPVGTGYIKYYRAVLNGENPSLGVIFSEVRWTKHTLLLVLNSGILMAFYILGVALIEWPVVGVVLFVINGFVIAFFSMIFYVMEYYEITTFRKSFYTTAVLMLGNRILMFSYKLLFYLIYGVLIALGVICGFLVYSMIATNMALAILFGVCGAIVFLFLYTLVTVYYHACNETFFEDMIIHKKNVDAKKGVKNVEVAAEPVVEEVVEETPAEEVPAEKAAPAPKKTAAKKAPAKKSTAKKSTAKKTTTKKATK